MPGKPPPTNRARGLRAEPMDDDYIAQPRARLTDEAATQILDFLYDLIGDFESAYFIELRRHRHAQARRRYGPTAPTVRDRDDEPF